MGHKDGKQSTENRYIGLLLCVLAKNLLSVPKAAAGRRSERENFIPEEMRVNSNGSTDSFVGTHMWTRAMWRRRRLIERHNALAERPLESVSHTDKDLNLF